MGKAGVLLLLAGGTALYAQQGQERPRPGWPCVPGRAADPAYLEVSEGTGGQIFLFQKGEVAQSGVVMNASHTHPATILRAVGNLAGTRDLEFPVDSSVKSILVLVSLQCRNEIRVTRPSGSELTAMNSAQSVDLQAGKNLRVDNPEPGVWRVRLTGTGLYVASVQAKADVALAGVSVSIDGEGRNVQGRISGEVSNVRMQLVDAAGSRISDVETMETDGEGAWRASAAPRGERFRVLVTGIDGSGRPFQRVDPVLLKR